MLLTDTHSNPRIDLAHQRGRLSTGDCGRVVVAGSHVERSSGQLGAWPALIGAPGSELVQDIGNTVSQTSWTARAP